MEKFDVQGPVSLLSFPSIGTLRQIVITMATARILDSDWPSSDVAMVVATDCKVIIDITS